MTNIPVAAWSTSATIPTNCANNSKQSVLERAYEHLPRRALPALFWRHEPRLRRHAARVVAQELTSAWLWPVPAGAPRSEGFAFDDPGHDHGSGPGCPIRGRSDRRRRVCTRCAEKRKNNTAVASRIEGRQIDQDERAIVFEDTVVDRPIFIDAWTWLSPRERRSSPPARCWTAQRDGKRLLLSDQSGSVRGDLHYGDLDRPLERVTRSPSPSAGYLD